MVSIVAIYHARHSVETGGFSVGEGKFVIPDKQRTHPRAYRTGKPKGRQDGRRLGVSEGLGEGGNWEA